MLESGSIAPPFCLPDQDGQPRALADWLRTGPVILYFYPADFTPGCTREACMIRDLHGRLAALGLRIVGISPQDADSHRRFRERHQLPFDLLCDVGKTVARLYEVEGPFGLGVRRATFLIDPDGVVRDGVLADLRIGRHEEFIRNALSVAERDRLASAAAGAQ